MGLITNKSVNQSQNAGSKNLRSPKNNRKLVLDSADI